MDTEELIEKITTRVKENLILFSEDPFQVPVGVSARHVHLAREHVELWQGIQAYSTEKFKPEKPVCMCGAGVFNRPEGRA